MLFDRSNATSRPFKAGVLLVTSFVLVATPLAAQAAPLAASSVGKSQLVKAADSAEFSARKRYRRGGNAAGLAMMGMMIGTIGSMIAAQRQRDAYDEAYNRAHASYYYPSGYAEPQPYAYHHPHVYHQSQAYYRPHAQPHVRHHHPHVHRSHAPVARVINKAMFHR